jgi:hypothetical protein
LAVFTQSAADASWLLSYLVIYNGSGGFLKESAVLAAPTPHLDPGLVPGHLADFFESYANTGGPPSWGGWPLDGSVKQTVDHFLSVKQAILAGGDFQDPMTITPTDNSVLFGYHGGDILCGALHDSVQIEAPPDKPIIQPRNLSNWGPLLPPGRYTRLQKQQLIDYCVTIRPLPKIVIVSFLGWTYTITGTAQI